MNYFLENIIEKIIIEKVREIVSRDDEIVNSEKNILDICALALNNLPAKYVVTVKGEAYTKLEFLKIQYKVDIITEIIKAMEIVKKNPRD
ncbi:MAG: late competence development ComFB family protein [Candidatus Muirbacterium halophilum]|nr:late competence development ComFB family protein [Candidatus Muirbacterium halophilum]MCK9474708.1 late competence development ComFB family protein [Candidatus Muirbacterium halophilum]